MFQVEKRQGLPAGRRVRMVMSMTWIGRGTGCLRVGGLIFQDRGSSTEANHPYSVSGMVSSGCVIDVF